MGQEAKNIFLFVTFFPPSVFYKAEEPLPAMADKVSEPGKSKRSSQYSVLWPLSAETPFLFPCSRPLKATEQSVLLFLSESSGITKAVLQRWQTPFHKRNPVLNAYLHSCGAYLGLFHLIRKEHIAGRVGNHTTFSPIITVEKIWNTRSIKL